MSEETILVVDDEDDILELVRFNLERERFEVLTARNGERALELAFKHVPDAIILDLMLPGIDGNEVCRSLKREASTQKTPIIMLTAKSEEVDVVTGLELGADDYITKPFSPKVLVARLKASLRRRREQAQDRSLFFRDKQLVMDPDRRELLLNGKRIQLTYTEFELLRFLALRPGYVFSRKQIVRAVKGDGYPVTERSIDVQIVNIRKKLGDNNSYIETVRGVGYKFTV